MLHQVVLSGVRDYAKTGGKKGKPGYRTPVHFESRQKYKAAATRKNKRCFSSKCRSGFSTMVLNITSAIPRGKTLSYKEVAKKAGNEKAARAVGNILNKNKDPKVPCHRVIKSDGCTGGYNKGEREKIKILKKEKAL